MIRTINRIFLSLVVLAAILAVTASLFIAFISDRIFQNSINDSASYRWNKAYSGYISTIRMDRWNSRYHAAYADFIMMDAGFRDRKLSHVKKAEELYLKAIALNPEWAEYHLKLGLAKLTYSPKDAFKCFVRAYECDSNGYWLSRRIFEAGMRRWSALGQEEKTFIAATGKKILDSRRDIRKRYTRIEDMLKNGDFVGKEHTVILPGQWNSEDGNRSLSNGEMYWDGTIDSLIALPAKECEVSIKAKGSKADGIWPYMLVECNGTVIGVAVVDSPSWEEYRFYLKGDGSPAVISVSFMNDGLSAKGEDRNLFIGEVRATAKSITALNLS
jgi:tetratricopeptide (TPR) repeat protein